MPRSPKRIESSLFVGILSLGLGTSPPALAVVVPQTLSIGGELLNADGSPLTQSNINFHLDVYDAAGLCVLYSENHQGENLSSTAGHFNLILGDGTSIVNNVGAAGALDVKVFSNRGATPVANCGARTSVPLGAGDLRLVRVTYDAGGGSGRHVALGPDRFVRVRGRRGNVERVWFRRLHSGERHRRAEPGEYRVRV